MAIPKEWDLTGKTAIITADRRGWTTCLASALAEAGADVAIAGSANSDMLEAVSAVKRHNRKSMGIQTDIEKSESVDSMINIVVSKFGRLDILVNNARVEFGKSFERVDEHEWDTLMNFNVKSMFLCCQAAGRQMLQQGSGRIVNIGSILSVRGLWNSVAMCATQGAIYQMTSALALEWGRRGIRVNSIGAGWLTTAEDEVENEKELLVRYIPSRRKGHPNDLVSLLVYLASDSSDFVTGQTIFVDGGSLAHA